MEVNGLVTPQPPYPQGKSPWYPLDRLGGPQNPSGLGGEKKNSHPLLGLEVPIILSLLLLLLLFGTLRLLFALLIVV
jgi:hypothetical protein